LILLAFAYEISIFVSASRHIHTPAHAIESVDFEVYFIKGHKMKFKLPKRFVFDLFRIYLK